jgi:hypothetical protein
VLELAGVAGHVAGDTFARVAQLDRVTASEAAGCGFNSRRAHQFACKLKNFVRLI